MKIKDSVFGELEYDYVWTKDTSVEFCGKEVNIALIVDGDEDGEFSEKRLINEEVARVGYQDVAI